MPFRAVVKPMVCATWAWHLSSVFIFTFYVHSFSHLLTALFQSFGLPCKCPDSSSESMRPTVGSSCRLWSHTGHWLGTCSLEIDKPVLCFQLPHLLPLSPGPPGEPGFCHCWYNSLMTNSERRLLPRVLVLDFWLPV